MHNNISHGYLVPVNFFDTFNEQSKTIHDHQVYLTLRDKFETMGCVSLYKTHQFDRLNGLTKKEKEYYCAAYNNDLMNRLHLNEPRSLTFLAIGGPKKWTN